MKHLSGNGGDFGGPAQALYPGLTRIDGNVLVSKIDWRFRANCEVDLAQADVIDSAPALPRCGSPAAVVRNLGETAATAANPDTIQSSAHR